MSPVGIMPFDLGCHTNRYGDIDAAVFSTPSFTSIRISDRLICRLLVLVFFLRFALGLVPRCRLWLVVRGALRLTAACTLAL